KIMMCWVTETNENAHKYIRPDSYKFHSSMMGGLGIGANISKFDDASVQIYKGHIAKYKEIRDTVQFGDQYRLLSPRESNLSAVQYINKNGKDIVIFVFLHGQKYGDFNPNVRLQGLEPDALYQVNDLRLHGSTLMNAGLAVDLFGDFDSTLIRITKLNE
ncbi:MAG: alpha-galactosidase, partial [Firmicutes bacterium]|nr:alpha-galactosidase [Bacillota bacterium]